MPDQVAVVLPIMDPEQLVLKYLAARRKWRDAEKALEEVIDIVGSALHLVQERGSLFTDSWLETFHRGHWPTRDEVLKAVENCKMTRDAAVQDYQAIPEAFRE